MTSQQPRYQGRRHPEKGEGPGNEVDVTTALLVSPANDEISLLCKMSFFLLQTSFIVWKHQYVRRSVIVWVKEVLRKTILAFIRHFRNEESHLAVACETVTGDKMAASQLH